MVPTAEAGARPLGVRELAARPGTVVPFSTATVTLRGIDRRARLRFAAVGAARPSSGSPPPAGRLLAVELALEPPSSPGVWVTANAAPPSEHEHADDRQHAGRACCRRGADTGARAGGAMTSGVLRRAARGGATTRGAGRGRAGVAAEPAVRRMGGRPRRVAGRPAARRSGAGDRGRPPGALARGRRSGACGRVGGGGLGAGSRCRGRGAGESRCRAVAACAALPAGWRRLGGVLVRLGRPARARRRRPAWPSPARPAAAAAGASAVGAAGVTAEPAPRVAPRRRRSALAAAAAAAGRGAGAARRGGAAVVAPTGCGAAPGRGLAPRGARVRAGRQRAGGRSRALLGLGHHAPGHGLLAWAVVRALGRAARPTRAGA